MNRKEMLGYLLRVAEPVLRAAAADELKLRMPVGVEPDLTDRKTYTCFEAIGRLIMGMGAWLASEPEDEEEAALQKEYLALSRQAIRNQLNPNAGDYGCFPALNRAKSQSLVDMAFLVQGIYRGKSVLLDPMDEETKGWLLDALLICREIEPYFNNWILFSAYVEAGIYLLTGTCDFERVDRYLDQMEEWYAGDGIYKDGPHFAMDYYNSYVIHPMICDVCEILEAHLKRGPQKAQYYARLSRYAAIQERQIAPDGTYIVIGRSSAYRCGAFFALAQAALLEILPESLKPAQVRCALSEVIKHTLVDSSFDAQGFLWIGICGYQPLTGEGYISTGSLYLCTGAFLVLGLPAGNEFWTGGDALWTQKRIWSGEDVMRDEKLADEVIKWIG